MINHSHVVFGGRATIVLFLLLRGGLASAGSITIDDFSTPNPSTKADVYVISLINPNPTTFTDVGTGILNNAPSVPLGQREVTVHVTSAPVGFVDATGTLGGGSFVFGTASGAGATATLFYSAPGGGALGGVDLTSNNANKGINLTFASLDSASANAIDFAAVAVGPTGAVAASGSFARLVAPGSYFVPFASFTPTVGTFNFDSVDTLQLILNVSSIRDVDFTLTAITATVPEPSTLAMGLCGALAGMAYTRRRVLRPS